MSTSVVNIIVVLVHCTILFITIYITIIVVIALPLLLLLFLLSVSSLYLLYIFPKFLKVSEADFLLFDNVVHVDAGDNNLPFSKL